MCLMASIIFGLFFRKTVQIYASHVHYIVYTLYMKKLVLLGSFLLLITLTLPADQASLVLHEDLSGRISIRNNADFLVVELSKISGNPLTLGLESGEYRIQLESGNNFYRAEVTLLESGSTTLGMVDFQLVAAASDMRRRVDEDEGWSNPFGNSLYTFIFNIVDEDFRFPLFGFVNIAVGNFNNFQAGFVNWNTRNLTGLQAAYVNVVGGNLSGFQAGFINSVTGNADGFQLGFINTTRGLDGFQAGFVNAAINGGRGFQGGFFNVSTQEFKGVQLGFINYADSIEDGVPIGFLSIVRRGGYRAIEYSFSEFFPLTLGFKIGVERFYTSFYWGFNPFENDRYDGSVFGWGFGSIIPINNSFYFNPEFISINSEYWRYYNEVSEGDMDEEMPDGWYIWEYTRSRSLVLNFGYNFNRYFSIAAGPSITWLNHSMYGPIEPLFSLFQHNIRDKNSIVIGARANLRLRF